MEPKGHPLRKRHASHRTRPDGRGVDAALAEFDFRVDGKQASAIVHRPTATWRVSICIGPVTTDPSQLDALLAAIARANDELPKGMAKHARLLERDCYLWVEAVRDFFWVTKKPESMHERLAKVLADATALATHKASVRLLDEFGRPI